MSKYELTSEAEPEFTIGLRDGKKRKQKRFIQILNDKFET